MEESIYTRQQFWGAFEPKEAEVGEMMPISKLPSAAPDKGRKSVIPKTGSAPDELQQPVEGEQPEQNPQAQPIKPRVDVSGKEPPKLIKEKTAHHYAMPSIRRYPLDSYSDVVEAASYFDEYRTGFDPAHRREFCSNLVKRAEVLGVPVSDYVQQYGAVGYAPAEVRAIALDARGLLLDDDGRAVLDKVAEIGALLPPDDFVVLLGEFDKVAGIEHVYDSHIPDPYLSVFGKTAEAEEDGSYIIGNDYTTNDQLKRLAQMPCEDLKGTFTEEFITDFKKDPIALFKSLPADQKKILARMANEPVVNAG